MSKVIIVNEKDEVVGVKDRNDRDSAHIIRVAALWVFNSRGEVLLAQRSLDKVRSPGKWGPAAAGTVEEGETYESNILKETEEEIGLRTTSGALILGPKNFVTNEHAYFVQTYFLEVNEPATYFKPRVGEVEKVEWIALDKLENWIKEKPEDFTPAGKVYLSDFKNFWEKKSHGA